MDSVDFPELPELGVEDSPTAPSMGSSAMPHQQLDHLFELARNGCIPRNRELKPWEPARLNATHFQILILRACGYRQGVIADILNEQLGLKITDRNVSVICNHPDAVYILSKMIGYASDNVADLATRIKGYAVEALESNVRIMRTSRDERVSSRIGFDLLDRAGYGAVQKSQVETKATVVLQAGAANNLATAMREIAGSKEVPAQYVMTGAQRIEGEGSGNPLDSTESADASGQPLADAPPVRASLSRQPAKLDRDANADDLKDYESVLRASPLKKVG